MTNPEGVTLTCQRCPFPAVTRVTQYRRTALQRALRRTGRSVVVCDRHVPAGLRYVRTGWWT